MELSGVEELQDDLFDADGGLSETATVGSWTGQIIAAVDDDGDAPSGELGYSTRLRRLSFRRNTAPSLAVGTAVTWRGLGWLVDATEETDEDLLTVYIVPDPQPVRRRAFTDGFDQGFS